MVTPLDSDTCTRDVIGHYIFGRITRRCKNIGKPVGSHIRNITSRIQITQYFLDYCGKIYSDLHNNSLTLLKWLRWISIFHLGIALNFSYYILISLSILIAFQHWQKLESTWFPDSPIFASYLQSRGRKRLYYHNDGEDKKEEKKRGNISYLPFHLPHRRSSAPLLTVVINSESTEDNSV